VKNGLTWTDRAFIAIMALALSKLTGLADYSWKWVLIPAALAAGIEFGLTIRRHLVNLAIGKALIDTLNAQKEKPVNKSLVA